MTEILQRMKDLATQSANGTNSQEDRDALQAEYNELGNEMANIVKNTTFAGENLFSDGGASAVTDGSAGKFSAAVTFQIGATTAEKLDLDVNAELTALAGALTGISTNYEDGTAGTEIATAATANPAIDSIAAVLDSVGALRAKFGATINRLDHTNNNLANMKDNTDMAKGRILDADFASESANMSKNSMLLQSGISMLKQTSQMPSMVMSLLG
jgi:flagellin